MSPNPWNCAIKKADPWAGFDNSCEDCELVAPDASCPGGCKVRLTAEAYNKMANNKQRLIAFNLRHYFFSKILGFLFNTLTNFKAYKKVRLSIFGF